MKLHEVTHRADVRRENHYCGPATVSAVTGRTAECAVEWFRVYRDRNYGVNGTRACIIKGVWDKELKWVMVQLGYNLVPFRSWPKDNQGPTLNAFLKSRTADERDALLVISYGNHYVAVRHKTAQDGGLRCWASDLPHQRARVHTVWRATFVIHPESERIRKMRKEPMP